jgi:hypothetical protein
MAGLKINSKFNQMSALGLFIAELAIIIAYFYNGSYGMLLTLTFVILVFTRKNYTTTEKFILLLIFSVPLSYIEFYGITQQESHILSWYIIILGFFIVACIRNYFLKITNASRQLVFLLTVVIAMVFLESIFFSPNLGVALIDFFQFCLILIPIAIVFDQRAYLSKQVSEKCKELFISAILSSILAVAVCNYYQQFIYDQFGIAIGNFIMGGTSSLIWGRSVQSHLLGIGVIIALTRFCSEYKIRYILFIGLMIGAIVLDGSRTGFFTVLIIAPFIVFYSKILLKIKTLFLSIVSLTFFVVYLVSSISTQLTSRSTETLLDNNGRFQNYIENWQLFTSTPKAFLLGSGLSKENYSIIVVHNFIFGFFVENGIFVAIIIVCMLFLLVKYLRKSKYTSLAYAVFVGAMVYANLYGSFFANIYIMVVIISCEKHNLLTENSFPMVKILKKQSFVEKGVKPYDA